MIQTEKYQHAKIYKISDTNDEMTYIGSTINSLKTRFGEHKYSYKLWKQGYYNKTAIYDIFDKYGVDNCKIELLESYPCETRHDLCRREGFNIFNNKINKNIINKNIAGRSKTEQRNIKNICNKCGGRFTNANKKQHLKSIKHNKISTSIIKTMEQPKPIKKYKRSSPDYQKKYYQLHKAKMIAQIDVARKIRKLTPKAIEDYRKITVSKLNQNIFLKIPHKKMKQLNIVKNEETGLYY